MLHKGGYTSMVLPVYKVLVAEYDEEQLETLISSLARIPRVEVVGVARDSSELMNQVTQMYGEIDALIIDMSLGNGVSGADAYMRMPYRGIELPAIFLTDQEHIDVQSTYDLGVIDVLQKPFTFERLNKCIFQLQKALQIDRFLKSGGKIVPIIDSTIEQVMSIEIMYIETDSSKKTSLVKTEKALHPSRITMNQYESYLVSNNFKRVGRHLIVNIRRIEEIRGVEIIFDNNDRIPVNKKYVSDLLFSISSKEDVIRP
ncbi:hypothetical protein CA598_27010 [Paenibacillus sp. VTT E-133291]|nr:hypothetical protein CA598_27010 [Paenibacillus sp. VTT E-133291]